MSTDGPATPAPLSFTFIVEHLDPELGPWSALEYRTIATEAQKSSNKFILSSVPAELSGDPGMNAVRKAGGRVEASGVEVLFSPAMTTGRVCLLDPRAEKELVPEDGMVFGGFLFGGILGDDPPRDRTGELRKKGYEGRRLGPKQMTTDTAVRVTRIVVQDKVPLDQIPYVDYPELKLDEHESTEMPFRYVRGKDGGPVMPEGMMDLIRKDADKAFEDFLES